MTAFPATPCTMVQKSVKNESLTPSWDWQITRANNLAFARQRSSYLSSSLLSTVQPSTWLSILGRKPYLDSLNLTCFLAACAIIYHITALAAALSPLVMHTILALHNPTVMGPCSRLDLPRIVEAEFASK